MARTQMSISIKEQDEIFDIITQNPQIINWLSIGRLEPSADAVCDAVHFMEKRSKEHEEMKKALLCVFTKLTNAKEIRYYRQLKLLAIMFDLDGNNNSRLNMLNSEINKYKAVNGDLEKCNAPFISIRNLE